MFCVGHLFTAPCSTDQPPPPWLGALSAEPLGTRESSANACSAASWAICFTPSPIARKRASIHDRWKLTMTDVASAVMAPLARNLEAPSLNRPGMLSAYDRHLCGIMIPQTSANRQRLRKTDRIWGCSARAIECRESTYCGHGRSRPLTSQAGKRRAGESALRCRRATPRRTLAIRNLNNAKRACWDAIPTDDDAKGGAFTRSSHPSKHGDPNEVAQHPSRAKSFKDKSRAFSCLTRASSVAELPIGPRMIVVAMILPSVRPLFEGPAYWECDKAQAPVSPERQVRIRPCQANFPCLGVSCHSNHFARQRGLGRGKGRVEREPQMCVLRLYWTSTHLFLVAGEMHIRQSLSTPVRN